MTKKKKKLTPAQKAAKKQRQREYMTVFMNGKQKRLKRPPTIDGMDVDEFIRNNADPIWLHQNEMWEYMDMDDGDDWLPERMPATEVEWLEEIAKAYREAEDTIPFGLLSGEEIKPEDLFHLGPEICLKFRCIAMTEANMERAKEAALTSYVATLEKVADLFEIPQMSFAFSYVASHFGLDLLNEKKATQVLDYVEKHLGRLLALAS